MQEDDAVIDSSMLKIQVEKSATHLARLIRPNGKFVYRYCGTPEQPLSGYNILRHCGAIWAIDNTRRLRLAPQSLSSLVTPAIRRLLNRHIAHTDTGTAYVFSRRAIKLGGCGLALLALAPRRRHRETVQGLIRYIRDQDQGDGIFIHKRDRESFAPQPFQSDYYTGEALFGLITAAALIGDSEAAAYGVRTVLTLGQKEEGIAAQSHWMMYAAEAAYEVSPEPAILSYMLKLANHILSNAQYRQRDAGTPIACRTEALLCVARILQRSEGKAAERYTVLRTIRHNLHLQLACAAPNGGFTHGASSEVRIDYIQHNLACMAGYASLEPG